MSQEEKLQIVYLQELAKAQLEQAKQTTAILVWIGLGVLANLFAVALETIILK